MSAFIVDASVAFKWFHTEDERHIEEARALLSAFVRREHDLYVPPIFPLEILNTSARKWNYEERVVLELVEAMEALDLEIVAPDLGRVARWTSRGLTAYDACYVALAEMMGATLVTDDRRMQNIAGDLALALSDFPAIGR